MPGTMYDPLKERGWEFRDAWWKRDVARCTVDDRTIALSLVNSNTSKPEI